MRYVHILWVQIVRMLVFMLYLKIQGNSKQNSSWGVCVCVCTYVYTWKLANLNTLWKFKRLIITLTSFKKIGKFTLLDMLSNQDSDVLVQKQTKPEQWEDQE